MLFYPIDSEIRSAIDAIETNPITAVGFEDYNKKLRFLSEYVCQSILKGDKSLILCEDEEMINALKRNLSQFKLTSSVLVLELDKDISETEIHKLRLYSKSVKSVELKQAQEKYKLLKSQYKSIENRIKDSFQYLYEDSPAIGVRDKIINKKIAANHRDNSIINSVVKVDPDTISKLRKFYKNSFETFEQGDPFKQLFYKNIGSDQQAIPKVRALHEKARKIIAEARELEKLLLENIKEKNERLFVITENAYLRVQAFMLSKQNPDLEKKKAWYEGKKGKAGLDFFSEILNEIEILIDATNYEKKIVSYEDLAQLLNTWDLSKNEFHKSKEKESNHIVNQLNCRNSGNEQLIAFNEKLNTICKELNSTGFFKLDLENNAWNFNGQLTTSKRLMQLLGNANYLLDHAEYIYWRILLNELDPTQRQFINELKLESKEAWLDIYEDSILDKSYNEIFYSRLPDSEVYHQVLNGLMDMLPKTAKTLVESRYESKISNSLKLFEKQSPEVYKSILRKKQIPEIGWNEILNGGFQFISDVYPIIFLNSSSYEQELHAEWDQVILLDLKDPVEKLDKFKCNKVLLVTEQESGAHEREEIHQQFVHGSLSEIRNSISDLETKMTSLKPLCEQIRAYNKSAAVYQSKESIVISFLSEERMKGFLESNATLQLNQLHLMGEESDLLNEALVSDSENKILLIENGLLNGKQAIDWRWQKEIIQKIQYYGFQVFSFDDKKLYAQGKSIYSIELRPHTITEEVSL